MALTGKHFQEIKLFCYWCERVKQPTVRPADVNREQRKNDTNKTKREQSRLSATLSTKNAK
jgi:hypothetical protein